MNPGYDYKEMGWEALALDEPNMGYEFNTLMFWRTGSGVVFSGASCGCSCPIPFEEYAGETTEEVEQKLERVGSLAQAERIIDGWNKGYDNRPLVDHGERTAALDTLKAWGLS